MAEPVPQTPSLLVPVKLDAFILNQNIVNAKADEAKLAPITQPNYTFLRISDYLVEHDILPHVDLHNATPANRNSRVTDLGTGATRENRIGIYLHWMLPRFYRGGEASTRSVKDPNAQRKQKGLHALDLEDNEADATAPHFREAPNRWLVVRRLAKESIKPEDAVIDLVKTWVIEGDRMRSIDDLDVKVDLQVDVSPFITSGVDIKNIDIDQQAEVFIGSCADAKTWSETKEQIDRVELSVASSSNQLFPDFQHHCSNVFSMVDTLEDSAGKHLDSAVASYFVIGWHENAKHDPMYMADQSTKRRERLQALNMNTIKDEILVDEIKKWLDSTDGTRTLCHGAMYEVNWMKEGVPSTILANKCSEMLGHDMQISVGTTPMDSLLSYIRAHRDPKTQDLEDDIFQLQKLLRAQDDSVDGLAAAEDELQSHNFAKFNGGSSYKFPQAENAKIGEAPSETQAQKLRVLNSIQRYYDALQRRIELVQWKLFSIWWRYISDTDNKGGTHNTAYENELRSLDKRYDLLVLAQREVLDAKTKQLSMFKGLELKEGVLQDFHQQSNPTVMIAGASAGWPHDFLKGLDVRLESQVVKPVNGISEPKGNFSHGQNIPQTSDNPEHDKAFSLHCPPPECLASCRKLIDEFINLADDTKQPSELQHAPLYHDKQHLKPKNGENNTWRDRFSDTQPWFPLFVEWEAEYTHIPFENWDLMVDKDNKVKFGLKNDVTKLRDTRPDYRVLSGRSLILPQPVFSLGASIDRLFSTLTPAELNAALPENKREELRSNLDRLAFLSFPLEGLTNHLLTLTSGNHIKPTVRATGKKIQAMAKASLPDINFLPEHIEKIGTQSDLAPYGVLISLLGKEYPAFKPVTHGQLRFTKLNIIDKFGQVAHALDPEPRINHGPEKLYPCIGDYYAPQLLETGCPNVVVPEEKKGHNEFIQLPPTINQPARLNSTFLTRNTDNPNLSRWRPSNDWEESPVWGWIVVNYVDHGLQLFLPDGSFYREVRLTTPQHEARDTASTAWLPFEAPTKSPATGQLDKLIEKLATNQKYLGEFISMVQAASEKMAPAPNSYGQFVNSLVGRPLALVYTGWSLEISHSPRENQSTIRNAERPIIPEPDLIDNVNKKYSFKVKFGDKDRSFDGMVAYFNVKDQPADGDELNLDEIYTYFIDPKSQPSQTYLQSITPTTYPKFLATYIDPVDYALLATTSESAITASIQYTSNLFSDFRLFGAIIDPFVAMHAYTSILPNQPLKLPSWTLETAFKKMRTFFRWGPMLVRDDVADFDVKFKLPLEDGTQYDLTDAKQVYDKSGVLMPSLSAGDWAWLQPYGNGKLMALNVGGESEEKRNKDGQDGPYTAIEGYIQMKAPITVQKDPGQKDPDHKKPDSGTSEDAI